MANDVHEWLERTALRQGFDELAIGVMVHDATGRPVHASAAALALLGWSSMPAMSLEEMVSRLAITGTSGEPLRVEDLPVSQVLRGRPEAECAISVRLGSGLRRVLRTLARPVRGDGGRLCGVTQALLDDGEAATARGTVRDLVEQSTPVLNVGERILLQPLIGTLDSQRASLAMEKLLDAIGRTGARVAIVDITGVSAVDTATADHLLRSLTAARLLGCEVVLSGVSPPIARTITVLGLDLSALRTKRDVAAAIAFGRRRVEAAEAVARSEPSNVEENTESVPAAPANRIVSVR